MKKRVFSITIAGLFCVATISVSAYPGGRGSVRYSGASSAPVRYQKPMNTPGYSAAGSSGSVPSRYQKPMNSGPGTRAYRRASDYYYYPGSAGYETYQGGEDYQGDGIPGYEDRPQQKAPKSTSRPVKAPVTGDVISRLPSGSHTATLAGKEYYYSQGIYYVKGQQKRTYEAVPPPLGLTVSELPPGTTQVKNGLYQHRDVYYRPAYDNGELAYVVSNP